MMKYKRVYFVFAPTSVYIIMSIPAFFMKLFSALYKKNIEILKRYLWARKIVNQVRCEAEYRFTDADRRNYRTCVLEYAYNDRAVFVHVRFRKKADEAEYARYQQACGIATGLKVTNLRKDGGYMAFALLNDHYLPILETAADDKKMMIGTNLTGAYFWDFAHNPHMLVVGPTGTGKTNFLMDLLHGLKKNQIDCYCIDGKGVDFVSVKEQFKSYLRATPNNKEEVIAYLSVFYDMMMKRLAKMEERAVGQYFKLGLKPVFVIIEEYTDVVMRFTKNERERWDNYVSSIARLGRATGINLILTLQRPDTVYIKGELRSNLMMRVVLGNADAMCYQMAFDTQELEPLSLGQAWVRQNTVLDTIKIPLYEELVACGN